MTKRNGERTRPWTTDLLVSCRGLTAAALLLVCFAIAACVDWPAVLTQLVDARRLGSMLRVQFAKAEEASNRAVMEESDEASRVAANDARRALQEVTRAVPALRRLLQSLRYDGDLVLLDGFAARFREYERLEDEVLPLAGENTNLKAQRLALGPGRAAAEEFQAGVDAAARSATGSQASVAALLAAEAHAAVLDIRVLQPSHIAERDDRVMTAIEGTMARHGDEARRALHRLRLAVPPSAATSVSNATAALDRFMALNGEIVALSRRNTNVRSLALALGRKRVVAAQCEERLQALVEALEKHEFTATR